MARDSEGMNRTRALLLAAFVLVATGAGILVLGGDDEAEEEPVLAPQAEEVIEVTPLLPSGALKSASWHEAGGREAAAAEELEEGDGTMSLIEEYGSELGESEQDRRFRRSLEDMVSDIHGLGVYVAPAEEDEKKKEE